MASEWKQTKGRSNPGTGEFHSAVDIDLIASDGKRLLLDGDTELPEACIKCGASPAGGKRYSKKLYWVTPLAWLAIPLGLIPALILVLVLRKQLVLGFSLCRAHRRKRLVLMLTTVAMLPAAVAAFATAVAVDEISSETAGVLGMSGLGLIIAFFALLIVMDNQIMVTRHRAGIFHLKGAGKEFLALVEEEAGRRAEKPGEPDYVG